MRQVMIDRRTLLRAAAVAGAGAWGAPGALASIRPVHRRDVLPSQVASDPIAALADELEYDPDRIFRFVADEIAYEPYEGMLRGPSMTLRGRAGNAVDKAALLAALLDASLVESRFVIGTLDEGTADALATMTVDAGRVRDRAAAALIPQQATTPEPSSEPDPDLDRIPEIDRALTAWASDAIDSSTRMILDALAGAGITLPSGPAPTPAQEPARHVWVQVRSGNEWLDLDPTLPGTAPGTAGGTATGGPLRTIPDDLRHRIDFDVILERVAGDGVVQDTILEQSSFADELMDVSLLLGHAKPESLQGLGSNIGSLLTGGVRYHTVLQVGDTAAVGTSPIILAGDDAADPFAPAVPSGTPGVRDGDAVAEWLEVRVSAPDGSVRTARRTLFDRVGAAARLAGPVEPAAIPPASLVDLDDAHPNEFLPLTAAHFLSVGTGPEAWPSPEIPSGQEVLALGIPVRLYAVARDATNARLAPDRGVSVHLARPNITMDSYAPVIRDDGSMSVVETLDLLHRGFGTLPVEGVPSRVPGSLLVGVTSHVAERLRGGAGLPPDLAVDPPGPSVGAVFERAAADGVGLRVLTGALPPDHGYPPVAAAFLGDALAEGWLAIVPERPVQLGGESRLGWWLVDPLTTETRDQMDDGRGSEMTEYVNQVISIAVLTAGALIALAACIGGRMGKLPVHLSLSYTLGSTTETLTAC